MSTVAEIEEAIKNLSPEALAEFRTWYEVYDSEQWDRQILRDADEGKLNKLAARALADHRQGKATTL